MSERAQPSDHGVLPDPQAEIARLKHVISDCIPWIASHPRGAAQEALANACEAIGVDPWEWTTHPDVLAQRVDRRSE